MYEHTICGTRIMGFLRALSFGSVFIIVALNACVCSDFPYGDLVIEPCVEVNYGDYEEFV